MDAMIVNARFPVFLPEVRPPGFRNRVPAVVFLEATVGILEVPSSEAPLVLHATSDHISRGRTDVFEFRAFDGRFFRPLGKSLEGFSPVNLREPWGRPPGLCRLIDEVYVDVLPYAKKAYPVGVLKILRGEMFPQFNQVSFIEKSSRTELDEENRGRVATALTRFEEQCSSYIVVDGLVWVECIEPLLSVETDPRSPECGRITIFTGELPSYSPLLARGYLHSSVRLFSFDELDTVKKIAFSPKAPLEGGKFSVLAHEASYFTNDFPYIYDGVRMLAELQTDQEISKDMVARVTEFLANDDNWTHDALEELLRDCLSAANPNSDVKKYVPAMIRRLLDRPITIDIGEPRSAFGLR
jgi:hypothetical protein